MPSPFPGMNPFLEQEDAWTDFHASMMPAISDVLCPQVCPFFMVRIQRRVCFHEPTARLRIGMGPPVVCEFHRFLEIRECKSRELITVIELLSPTDKRPGPDREQYLATRGNVLRSAAHFVEFDLLRGWPKMPGEDAPISDYSVMVSVVEERPRAAYWPIALKDRLPPIPIPLRVPVPVARLDLQDVLHLVYDRAYYKDYIYEGSPIPALGQDSLAWAQTVIGR